MTEIIMLNEQERNRFASWLEQQCESNRGMLEQLEKMPHAAPVAENMKRETAAMLIVAKKLRSIEQITISPNAP